MKKIPGYEILEKLDDTRKTSVFRGRKLPHDADTVIIKILNTGYSTVSEIARFKQEYEILRNLHIEGVRQTCDVVENDDEIALILEDFDAVSLQEYIRERKPELKEFLEIGITLSHILGELHKNNIVHKDIKPRNILINKKTRNLKIADFGIAAELTGEHEEIYDKKIVEGTLVYMSPEQTGRMNRAVDYRTDLYSLGITFYEMLTGTVPFKSKWSGSSADPLEIIHQHIAKKPVPPEEADPGIPAMIWTIVMKLLSKTAEERYQNGFGLKADLEECKARLEKGGTIEPFKTGAHDISLKFNLPQKLFGREEEIEHLIAAFDRVSHPSVSPVVQGVEMMLVSGAPGIGKSALIKEINKPIVAKRGYFISGKYEQYGRDVPYSGIIQAFRGLVRYVLSENKEKIDAWKEDIQEALGPAGKIITDVIPDIEFIIGHQADVPELNPEEGQNRLNRTFKSFIEIFARKEHPLVLFLDDLQWADLASLKLMEHIITDPGMESLLLIGAYRDTEVSEKHALTTILHEIGKEVVIINEIVLAPLGVEQVNNMLSEVFLCDKERSFPLAELVHGKTNGNPFFVKQFLKNLYDNKLLTIDSAEGWKWDTDAIRKMEITGNVVELMTGKIERLEENTRDILKIAACIGDRFDLETLSTVTEKPIGESLEDLTEAVEEGLIGITGDIYNFQHDRIRESAYSLISEENKKELHLKIGRLLLENSTPEGLADEIFYIVGQFNYGSDLLTASEELDELARLNHKAGLKAAASAAHEAAYRFFVRGIELVPGDPWETNYDLSLALYKGAGEAAHLSALYEEAEKIFDRVLEKGAGVLDKTGIYELKIMLYVNSNRLMEALELGKEALAMLGFPMPHKASRITILKETVKLKMKLRGRE
ncbi:MAG: serine/threonine-protein kinase PknK, partial [bacterium]|nr:serine/threonine-protein kinase PknK [bacterium]